MYTQGYQFPSHGGSLAQTASVDAHLGQSFNQSGAPLPGAILPADAGPWLHSSVHQPAIQAQAQNRMDKGGPLSQLFEDSRQARSNHMGSSSDRLYPGPSNEHLRRESWPPKRPLRSLLEAQPEVFQSSPTDVILEGYGQGRPWTRSSPSYYQNVENSYGPRDLSGGLTKFPYRPTSPEGRPALSGIPVSNRRRYSDQSELYPRPAVPSYHFPPDQSFCNQVPSSDTHKESLQRSDEYMHLPSQRGPPTKGLQNSDSHSHFVNSSPPGYSRLPNGPLKETEPPAKRRKCQSEYWSSNGTSNYNGHRSYSDSSPPDHSRSPPGHEDSFEPSAKKPKTGNSNSSDARHQHYLRRSSGSPIHSKDHIEPRSQGRKSRRSISPSPTRRSNANHQHYSGSGRRRSFGSPARSNDHMESRLQDRRTRRSLSPSPTRRSDANHQQNSGSGRRRSSGSPATSKDGVESRSQGRKSRPNPSFWPTGRSDPKNQHYSGSHHCCSKNRTVNCPGSSSQGSNSVVPHQSHQGSFDYQRASSAVDSRGPLPGAMSTVASHGEPPVPRLKDDSNRASSSLQAFGADVLSGSKASGCNCDIDCVLGGSLPCKLSGCSNPGCQGQGSLEIEEPPQKCHCGAGKPKKESAASGPSEVPPQTPGNLHSEKSPAGHSGCSGLNDSWTTFSETHQGNETMCDATTTDLEDSQTSEGELVPKNENNSKAGRRDKRRKAPGGRNNNSSTPNVSKTRPKGSHGNSSLSLSPISSSYPGKLL